MAKTDCSSGEQGATGLDRAKAAPERLIDFLKDVRSEMRKVVCRRAPRCSRRRSWCW